MGYDPKQPRNENGEWTSGSSGNNAGGGNRNISNSIKKDFSLELDRQSHSAFKSFKIKQGDRQIGNFETESYGKRVEINDVQSLSGPNSLGPHIRKLARELKKHWPEMETVSGFRESGSRAARGGKAIQIKIR